MKLSNIVKSFEKTLNKLDAFMLNNTAEIAKLNVELSTRNEEQEKAATIRHNMATLLGETN